MARTGNRRVQGEGAFEPGANKTYALMDLPRGSSGSVEAGPRGTIMAWPTVFLLELAILLAVVFVLAILGAFIDTPLGSVANPSVPENPSLAPWYLTGVQELTLHIHPVFGGIVLPTLLFVGLLAIPYLDRGAGGGKWFGSRRGLNAALGSAAATAVVWVVLEWLDLNRDLGSRLNQALDLTALAGGETAANWPQGFGFFGLYDLTEWSAFLWQGLIPLMILLALFAVLAAVAKFFFRCNRREVLIALFTSAMVTIVVLTFVGSLMRGTDMKLYAPWDTPPVIEAQR